MFHEPSGHLPRKSPNPNHLISAYFYPSVSLQPLSRITSQTVFFNPVLNRTGCNWLAGMSCFCSFWTTSPLALLYYAINRTTRYLYQETEKKEIRIACFVSKKYFNNAIGFWALDSSSHNENMILPTNLENARCGLYVYTQEERARECYLQPHYQNYGA